MTWTVARDVLGRRTTCAVDHSAEDYSDLSTTTEHYTGAVSVDSRTFAQQATATADFTLQWQAATVRAQAELSLDAGPSTYDVELTVRTWCDAEPFASRHWTRTVARDLG